MTFTPRWKRRGAFSYGDKIMEWKRAPGYSRYEVAANSQVRNATTGRIMSQVIMRNYLYVGIMPDPPGHQKTVRVHRLVWMAFYGSIPEGMVINHLDGCKTNNNLSNLEMVTPKQNAQHASRLGLLPKGDAHSSRTKNHRLKRGSAHYCAKLTEAEVALIKAIGREWPLNYTAVGRKFGVSGVLIRGIIDGRSWRHVMPTQLDISGGKRKGPVLRGRRDLMFVEMNGKPRK